MENILPHSPEVPQQDICKKTGVAPDYFLAAAAASAAAGGATGGARHLHGADSRRGRRQNRDVVVLQVPDENALAQAERRHVYDDLVGQIFHRRADAYFPLAEDQLAALLHAFRVAGQLDGHVDRDRLAGNHMEKVGVPVPGPSPDGTEPRA